MMFVGDTVICSESREQVKENLEVKVCPGKERVAVARQNMSVNERNPSRMVRLQGAEVKKIVDRVNSPEQNERRV